MRNIKHKVLPTLLAGMLAMVSLGLRAQSSSGGSTTLYGCMLSSWGDYFPSSGIAGIYKFNPYDVTTFSSVAPNIRVYGGGTYANGTYAAIAQQQRFVRLGFPLESITDRKKLNALTKAFLTFLE